MKNFKSKITGEVFEFTGTFKNSENEICYRIDAFRGILKSDTKLTKEKAWVSIIFNKDLDLENIIKSKERIKKLGGYGKVYKGYSEFTGTLEIILSLLKYMLAKEFITSELNFDCNPETRNEIIKSLNL